MDENLYADDSIQTLSPLEHVRKRPEVYIGSATTPDQLLLEIFSNALDEFNIGHGQVIEVNIKDGVARVEDHGQGFPIGVEREDGLTVMEASYSEVNTSGKFSEDGVYSGSSIGQNGLGAKISNYLSSSFRVLSWSSGREEQIVFRSGVKQEHTIDKSSREGSGTLVEFSPEAEFFENPHFSLGKFKEFFHEIACLCPGLVIVFNGEKITHEGISDFLDLKIKTEDEILSSRFIWDYACGQGSINLAMTYTSSPQSTLYSHINYGTTLTGPHVVAIKRAITRTFNLWGREQGYLKEKEDNLDGASIQEGMVLAFNIVTKDVAYEAQIKTNVSRVNMFDIVEKLSQELTIWLDNNPEDGKAILEKAVLARKASEAARKAREAVRGKKKKNKVFKMPTKLADCWSKDRHNCELLICEGVSAMTPLVGARDGKTQACYAVRGKMVNLRKTSFKKALENQEINNIITALGLDIDYGAKKLIYDPDNLRYGKIIACADADYDGYAIENLLFNILWFLCPDLFLHGHVYSTVPPLFRITTPKNEYIYVKDEEELEGYKKKSPKKIKSISRLKGLGEMDQDEVYHCLLNPSTRNIVQLSVDNIENTEKLFEKLYGAKVEPRVQYILDHSEEVIGG